MTSDRAVEDFVAKTVERFGRLECAFLNSGISYTSTSIFDTSEDMYDRVMNINFKSSMDLYALTQSLSNISPLSIPRDQAYSKGHEGSRKRGQHHPDFFHCRLARHSEFQENDHHASCPPSFLFPKILATMQRFPNKWAIASVSLGKHPSHTLERKLATASREAFQAIQLVYADLFAHA